MDHPRPSLRYVKADELENKPFDGFTVEGQDGEKFGDVNGFIVDISARRRQYVVVDAGGWFKSASPASTSMSSRAGQATSMRASRSTSPRSAAKASGARTT